MMTQIGPLFDYLKPLEEAVNEIANTWRPDDPNIARTFTARS